MCGICGEFRLDGRLAKPAVVQRMLTCLERRGPDDAGQYHDNALAFGHRRLAVIDLSEKSHQPMVDDELGLVLVFNGAIYNYPALRETLRGHGYRFFSDGDTEVILKAYHFWGDACVEHLHGMFAFAIWDKRHHSLFLARDRLGIKPLYYSLDGKVFRFASNTQALLAAGGVDTRIDAVALHHLFTLHAVVPAPRTILRGVRKLAPGCTQRLSTKGVEQAKAYWHLEAKRPSITLGDQEWLDAIHAALRAAVKKRLDIADVPVGVLLSGGLDSSLLVALLAEAGVDDLRTFSIGFEDVASESGNEFGYSDLVVDRYRTHHRKLHIPNAEVLPRLPEAVDAMSEPMFAQDAVAFYLLAEQVSREVKVVQSGQGADEVFGGYFWYPRMMREIIGEPVQRFRKHYFDRDHEELMAMLTEPWRGDDYTTALIARKLAEPGADTLMDAILRLDVTTLIVDDPVKRVDNMTMAWGLEARVPFLDHELVELAMQCPPELKLRDNGKYPLKAIARGLVPDAVIDRPKGYFPMPALKYVQGEFLDMMRDALNAAAARQRGLYSREYIDRLLAEPEKHLTRIQGSKLWHCALLEIWLQRVVDPLAAA